MEFRGKLLEQLSASFDAMETSGDKIGVCRVGLRACMSVMDPLLHERGPLLKYLPATYGSDPEALYADYFNNDEYKNPPLSIKQEPDYLQEQHYIKRRFIDVVGHSTLSDTPALRQAVQPKPKPTGLFVRYHTHKPTQRTIMDDIERYIGGSFCMDTIRAQQVYVYRVCGYLKVGYSYCGAQRKNKWNRRHTKQFTSGFRIHKVPCARIVEGLVLRLKAKDRKKMACDECTNKVKWHQEFVSGSYDELEHIILALKRFFKQPYRFYSDGDERWKIDEDVQVELWHLCRFLLRGW